MLRFGVILILGGALGCDEPPRARVGGTVGGAVDAAVTTPETGPPATVMSDALAAAGLDAAKLPPLADVGGAQLAAVMDTFSRALGLGCGDCHEADYAVPTPRTRIAHKMWDRLARGLVRGDGGALYCDSCHAGRATFLDRSDARPDGALGRWMQANYVTPLLRRDGAPHDCTTCHGEPFVGGFLDQWGGADELADAGPPPPDVGAPPDDLGGPAVDLGTVGCEALLVCLDGCAADTTCAGACKRHASAAARALLAAAQACADAACITAGRCRSSSDDSAGCDACFSNASSGGATGVACVPADDPICGACAAEWLACETS